MGKLPIDDFIRRRGTAPVPATAVGPRQRRLPTEDFLRRSNKSSPLPPASTTSQVSAGGMTEALRDFAARQWQGASAPPSSAYNVPGGVERSIARNTARMQSAGYTTPEPKPPWWQAVLSGLSASEFALTTAYKGTTTTGEKGLKGYTEGFYTGIRPLLVYLGLHPRPAEGREEYTADVIQEIPGLEPTESTWRNFLIRLGGVGIGIAGDPLSWVSAGQSSLWRRATQALAKHLGETVLEHQAAAALSSLKQYPTQLITGGGDSTLSPIGKYIPAVKGLPSKLTEILASTPPPELSSRLLKTLPSKLATDPETQAFAARLLAEEDALTKAMDRQIKEMPETWIAQRAQELLPEIQKAAITEGPLGIAPFFYPKLHKTLVTHKQWAKAGIPAVAEMMVGLKGVPLLEKGLENLRNVHIEMEAPAWLKNAVTTGVGVGKYKWFPFWEKVATPKYKLQVPTPADTVLIDKLLGIAAFKNDKLGLEAGLRPEMILKEDLAAATRRYGEREAPSALTPDLITEYKRRGLLSIADQLLSPITPTYRIHQGLYQLGLEHSAHDHVDKLLVMRTIDAFTDIFGKHWNEMDDVARFGEKETGFTFKNAGHQERVTEAAKFFDDLFNAKTGQIPAMERAAGIAKNYQLRLNYAATHIRLVDPADKIALQEMAMYYPDLAGLDRFLRRRSFPTLEAGVAAGEKYTYNVAEYSAVRMITALREINKRRFLNGLLEKGESWGILQKIPENNPDFMLSGFQPMGRAFPSLKGYLLREDAAVMLRHKFEPWLPGTVYWNLLRGFTRMWKPLATIWNPKFVNRNILGNIWLCFVGGLTNPVRFMQAWMLQDPAHSVGLAQTFQSMGAKWVRVAEGQERSVFGRETLQMFGKVEMKVGEEWVPVEALRAQIQDQGISRHGFLSQDLSRIVTDQIAERVPPMSSNLYERARYGLRKVRRGVEEANIAVEDNARIALYLDRRIKGESAVSAWEAVRKFLFDYDELTPTERRVRVQFPFWTWARKNLPLEVEQFFKQPGKFSAAMKVPNILFESKEDRERRIKYAPDWMKSVQVFAAPSFMRHTPQGEIRYLIPGMPYEDLIKVTDPLEFIAQQLNPAYKILIEQFVAKDLWSGRAYYPAELEKHPDLQFARVESDYAALPKFLWPLVGMHKIKDPMTGESTVVAHVRLVMLWRTLFRPGRELMKLSDADRSLFDRAFGWAAGISLVPLNEKRQWFYSRMQKYAETKAASKRVQKLATEER